ncbi:MAG: archease [Candidatus Methanomethylophilaceae archaeon]|jgi:SHS2 domain-containing protein|nr:archease [Candidatus Methanomethylophilaceae archaeon]NLF34191.1 archease [Thermoplasmatales archaeon]
MRYELVDHTADVMVRCTGGTLEECFGNAAYALIDQMVDASLVEEKVTVRIEAEGGDWEERLYSFLSEVLFVQDSEGMVFRVFDVSFEGDRVVCEARGEPLDRTKHRAKTEIKAITYHMLSVHPEVPGLTVIFDA